MCMTVNEVSSLLCKILTLIIVKHTCRQERRYHIPRRIVETCYNSAKPPENFQNLAEVQKTDSISTGRTSRNGLYN